MKYRYLYQTKDNETREGWISARDRADAYTRLRKQHIRPLRVIGNDPIRWQPWAIAAAFVVLASTIAVLWFEKSEELELPRSQISGNSEVISAGLSNGWADVLPTKLDCHLAAYAQPGWIALPPEVTDEDIANFENDLKRSFSVGVAPNNETKQLKKIVAKMRREMSDYLASGGSVSDYLRFLEDRQDQEREFRNRALESISRAPESMRDRVRITVNVRLKEMGLPLIEQ